MSDSSRFSQSRFLHAVLPAFVLAVSVGQIYAFTIFSDPIAQRLAATAEEAADLRAAVQFAFSLGIFFLGMGAAFFGKIVERNIRLSTMIGTALFSLVFNLPSLKVSEQRSETLAMSEYTNTINPIIDVLSMVCGIESLKTGIVSKGNTLIKQNAERTTIEGTMIAQIGRAHV